MNVLYVLAFLAQTADAGLTCHKLNQPGLYRELNPIMGQTCKSVVTRKLLIAVPPVFFLGDKNKRMWLIGLTAGGTIGVTFTLILGDSK